MDPTRIFAHLAQRHAAIATRELEIELVRLDEQFEDPHSQDTRQDTRQPPQSLIILRKISSITSVTSNDITFAIEHNDVAFISLIIEGKIPANANNILLYACRLGQTDIVRLILAEFRESLRKSLRASLRIASERGHTEIVRLLLGDVVCDDAFTAACANGCADIVGLFLERGVQRVSDGFVYACQYGHIEIVRMILKLSASGGFEEHLRFLERGNEAFQTAFQMACIYGRTDIVNELIGRCDPAADDYRALKGASENGHVEIVRKLLSALRLPLPQNVKDAFAAKARGRGHFEINALLLAGSHV
jgi:ankyrin repeat protein